MNCKQKHEGGEHQCENGGYIWEVKHENSVSEGHPEESYCVCNLFL